MCIDIYEKTKHIFSVDRIQLSEDLPWQFRMIILIYLTGVCVVCVCQFSQFMIEIAFGELRYIISYHHHKSSFR